MSENVFGRWIWDKKFGPPEAHLFFVLTKKQVKLSIVKARLKQLII